MNKLQKEQYDMLVEVDRICKKYKINYFLDGGTLLGAVRHKGFIPWDDDLDINMPRKDYEEFKKHVSELDKKYFYQDVYSDDKYGLMFAKIRLNNSHYIEDMSKNVKCHNGIFIDIFPFDNTIEEDSTTSKTYKKILFLRMLLLIKCGYSLNNDSIIKKIEILVLKTMSLFISRKKLIKMIEKQTSKYNNIETDYYADYSTPVFNKGIYKKEYFKKSTSLEFENKKFNCPNNYDDILTFLYKDYMEFPPEDERENRHGALEIIYPDKSKE